MKKLFNGILCAAVLTSFFASCKKETMTEPTQAGTTETATPNARGGGLVPAPVYTLTRRGADSLLYDATGRLIKVQHGATSYTKYTYGFNTITSETFTGADLNAKNIYQIDVNTGRVFESEQHKYSYPGANVTLNDTKWYKFEYDADGYLKKKYNKYKAWERSVFGWNSGNLVSVSFHDENNGIYAYTHYYHYNDADKVHVRPASTELDPYLKVFGKASKNLMSLEYRAHYFPTVEAEESLTYQLNADGYPTSCTVADFNTHQRLYSVNYLYHVAP